MIKKVIDYRKVFYKSTTNFGKEDIQRQGWELTLECGHTKLIRQKKTRFPKVAKCHLCSERKWI